jgi:hypothetical protein
MHEGEPAALGVPLVYRRLDFDVLNYDDARLGVMLHLAQHSGFDGVNVTHPFKQNSRCCTCWTRCRPMRRLSAHDDLRAGMIAK